MLPSPFLVRTAITLARWIPPAVFRALASAVGSLGFAVAGWRREVIHNNVQHLAPAASERERNGVVRRLFRNLAQDASDLFRLPSISRDAVIGLVDVSGLDALEQALRLGKGVIVVTPHLGPYELGAACLAALGLPVHGMVEDLDPATNAALGAYRGATGLKLISRDSGVRQLYRLLAQGQCVLLVADRVIGEGSDRLIVPFGNASRAIPTGPATLALATGAPLVFGYIVRAHGAHARYRLRLEPVLSPNGRTREDLTRDIGERMDAVVQQHPDQWYVFQPDWVARGVGA